MTKKTEGKKTEKPLSQSAVQGIVMPLRCRLFGHVPSGLITGFRQVDAFAITRCERCNTPIVSSFLRASAGVMNDLYGDKA